MRGGKELAAVARDLSETVTDPDIQATEVNDWQTVTRHSLVPRPPRPAFVACSTKSGGRPGQIYHVMCAAADVMYCSMIDPVASRLAGQTEQKE